MKRTQLKVEIDAEKVRRVKEHGGYGILNQIVEMAIDCYLMEAPLAGYNEDLRLGIEEIRAKIERDRTRQRFMQICMKETIDRNMGGIAAKGLTRPMLKDLTDGVREWWFNNLRVVPHDKEIHEAIRTYVSEHQVDLDVLRGEQVQKTMEDYIKEHLDQKSASAMCLGHELGGAREDCEL